MIKALKQEVLDSAYRKLWILKVLKLFYVFLDPSNFVNGDSYLYFILAPILKPLLLQDTRNRLVFGESNLKVKAVEINRYLDDDERRFAGPKIDVKTQVAWNPILQWPSLQYTLSRPCDSYVFSLGMVFLVLGQSSILHQSIPTFAKQFSAIPWLIHETHAILDDIFTFDQSQEILEEINDDPSPHVSPRKKQKAKNSEE
ncbi:hypothetical protein V8B55DRAFT_1563606 [Mucor lusitanicus]